MMARVHGWIVRRLVGQVVGVTRAVGRVQVDHHVRIEVVEQPHHRPRLGRVELDVVAVDVEPLRVRTRALSADRAVLQAAADQRHALVAVGVVDRIDEQHHRAEPVGVGAAGDLAHEREHRLLAFHLTGVNVRLDVDAQPAAAADGLGSCIGDLADNGERQRTPFERVAERGDVHERRGSIDHLEERNTSS